MGVHFFTLEELKRRLEGQGLKGDELYRLGPFLPADQKFSRGSVDFLVDRKWKMSLPAFEFEQWFNFDQRSPIPKPPRVKQDWIIGFVTNSPYEIVRVQYSNRTQVFSRKKAVIDSEGKSSFPFFARGHGEFGIASYSFEFDQSGTTLKEPEQLSKIIKESQESKKIAGAPLLQLWLEDSPWTVVPDINKQGERLVQFQRILILQAWIAALPVDGEVPLDGWLAESTPYCVSMIVDIPLGTRATFALQPSFSFDSFAFSAPANFRPTTVDRQRFAQVQKKDRGPQFHQVDQKRLKTNKPITSGETANEIGQKWIQQLFGT